MAGRPSRLIRIAAAHRVSASPDEVFARMADFDMFEALARRRSVPVERLGGEPPAWRIGVEWKGLAYVVELRVRTMTAPGGYLADVATRGIEGCAAVDIRPDGDGSVLRVAVDLGSLGVRGRMVVETLGLARPMLEGRLRGALARLAGEIEAGGD
jgi:hypothetical protein